MSGPIKAIQTSYAGCRFRSRMEARWAVFFDAMGLTWSYEPEGFEVGHHGPYLPDFFVPYLGGGVFCEVKPEGYRPIKAEVALWQAFSEMLGRTFILLNGAPDVRRYVGTNVRNCAAEWTSYSFANEQKLYIEPNETDMRNDAPRAEIERARSARFEFGEKPEFIPVGQPVSALSKRVVEAMNDGDEEGAEALHTRMIEAEIAAWNPEFKA